MGIVIDARKRFAERRAKALQERKKREQKERPLDKHEKALHDLIGDIT